MTRSYDRGCGINYRYVRETSHGLKSPSVTYMVANAEPSYDVGLYHVYDFKTRTLLYSNDKLCYEMICCISLRYNASNEILILMSSEACLL